MLGEELFVMLLWGLVWIIVGRWLAKRKGRWTTNIAVALFLFGPLAIIYLIFAKRDTDALEEEMVREGKRKRCPYCANVIRTEAILCPFCASDFTKPEQEEDNVGKEKQESTG